MTAAERFAAYGPSHWAALGFFAIGCVGLVLLGRAQRTAGQEPGEQARGFGRAYALAVVYVMIGTQLHSLLPGSSGSADPCRCNCATWRGPPRSSRSGRSAGAPSR
ncbi:hypothetical protein [Actinomadura madurae]|uniref:hypothetical protein n=1 Tax=Actinomadura madurae TaxID=1993 RepID=UPI0020D22B29|nr:hypothetical protein [Actinomadura madurae]MCP9980601.1 hypothetical protein [Actinomadura madurae]